ncbi:MAG: DUF5050 domain-containing protein [Clostridia bacterium]|nr:DUF5050 domain-containing protein [Clostridia bacterium]
MKTEEEKLKKKLKVNTIAIVVLLVILLVVLGFFMMKMTKAKNGKNNNDANMGLCVEVDDGTVYYQYNKGLIKKTKKEEKILTEDQAYSIHYFDGMLYYVSPSSNGGINIKKMDLEGKNESLLVTTASNSTKIYVENSKIYYLTSNPDTISRMDLNGENGETLLQRTVSDFKVVGDTIYFSDVMGFLYSINMNGENYKTIVEENKFSEFQVLDKYVYYFDEEASALKKINLEDTSKQEVVTDKLDCATFNVTSSGIYYLDKANGKIAFVSLNGKNTREIVSINTDNTWITLAGNAIYYVDNEAGQTVTKVIKTNGKEIK